MPRSLNSSLFNSKFARAMMLASIAITMSIFAGHRLSAQSYVLPADLEAKIARHPHVRQLTGWGSRPDWSADSRKVMFVSREYGDLFELDVATGKTRALTFHFRHAGIFRGYYLRNGDILMTAPRKHDPDFSTYGRFHESELWLLKGDLSAPPVPLGIQNIEGVAVSRDTMRIAWAELPGPRPERQSDSEFDLMSLGRPDYRIWMADIVNEEGKPRLINKRVVLQCDGVVGPIISVTTAVGERCGYLEPQNFVPGSDDLLFAMGTSGGGGGYRFDARSGKITKLTGTGYNELEGVFPDGQYGAVEHVESKQGENVLDETKRIDLWRVSLDGSRKMTQLTFFHELDPRLKSNQGVISPDGRWMAFGVSTGDVEEKVSGQGIGIYLLDLSAAGID